MSFETPIFEPTIEAERSRVRSSWVLLALLLASLPLAKIAYDVLAAWVLSRHPEVAEWLRMIM